MSAIEKAACDALVPECAAKAGTLPNGSACVSGDQCVSAFCLVNENACGTCASIPTVGASCKSAFDCQGALTCESGKCVALPKLGEPCLGFECGVGLSCVESVCVPNAKEGEACSTSTRSQPNCARDLGCVDGTCVKYQVVELGASCDAARQCRGDAQCQAGKCVAKQPIGGECRGSVDCAWWATCYGGKCEMAFSSCHK